MNSAHAHLPEDDLALFALALMPPEEAAYAQAHLKHCDQCRGEVARMQGDLVAYAFTADMQDPPSAARARLLDAVSREKKLHTPAVEPVLAPRSSILPDRDGRAATSRPRGVGGFGIFGWAGWAVAAGLAVFAGWEFQQRQDLHAQIAGQTDALHAQAVAGQETSERAARAQRVLQALTDPSAMQVALHLTANAAAPPKPEGHASYNASKGELVFVATHLQPVEPGKTYELWILPAATGVAPVAGGLFRPDVHGNASVVLPNIPRSVAAKGFGVTIEPAGGSKGPTMPIVLAGA